MYATETGFCMAYQEQCHSLGTLISAKKKKGNMFPEGQSDESGYKSGQPIFYIFVPLVLAFKILMKPNQIS